MPVTYTTSSSKIFAFDQRIKDQYPNEIENDKINSKKFCVLKKKSSNSEILLEVNPLNYQFDNLIAELNVINENPNRQIEDLEQFINEGPLKDLLKPYWFCQNLSGTYEGLSQWSSDPFNTFKKQEIEELKLEILKETNPEDLTKLKTKLLTATYQLKDGLMRRIAWGKIAFLLEIEYEKCSKDPNILAFSNRRVGWYSPSFILGDDFSITYSTNFGYGSASYFYLKLKYKNIDILPYSDWVNYRYAENYDIIRFTRKFELKNFSWFIAFSFTSEIFNNSINDPIIFMKEWIVNECKEMVDRLEIMVNHFEDLIVYDHWVYRVKLTFSGYELLDLKGEKISGALNFLDNITRLKEISNETDDFISRIMKCNKKIYSQLTKEVKILDEKINSKQEEIIKQLPIVETLKIQKDIYSPEFFKIRKEIEDNNKLISVCESYDMTIKRLKDEFDPEYSVINTEYEKEKSKLSALEGELWKLKDWKRKFEIHIQVIEKHFVEHDEILVA
jgi:hypothetical protein